MSPPDPKNITTCLALQLGVDVIAGLMLIAAVTIW
jgi:hypothetical protein